MTLWKLIDIVSKKVLPDPVFNYIRKHPFHPLLLVLGLWLLSSVGGSLFGDKKLSLKIPCTTIFGNDCFQQDGVQESPYRGWY